MPSITAVHLNTESSSVDRRRLSIALQVASAALAMALALSTLVGFTTGVILVASFLFGGILAFSMPVLQAIVPDLVPRSELAPAVSLKRRG